MKNNIRTIRNMACSTIARGEIFKHRNIMLYRIGAAYYVMRADQPISPTTTVETSSWHKALDVFESFLENDVPADIEVPTAACV